jgi:autotransporter-associated beta strand protein
MSHSPSQPAHLRQASPPLTIIVDNGDDSATIDSSDGTSLPEAVAISNAAPGTQTVVLDSAYYIELAADLVLTDDLTLDVSAANGGAVNYNTIAWAGNTLTVNTGSATFAFNSALDGTGTLVKTGSGTLVLSQNAATANILTKITGGEVSIGMAASLPYAGLELDGGTLSSGSSMLVDSGILVTQGVTLDSGGGTFQIDGSAVVEFSVAVDGSGGLAKTGGGTLKLSGSNSYAGATTISGGTLAIAGGQAIADGSAVTVASGATLNVTNAGSETIGSLAGAGHVTLGSKLVAGGDNSSTTFSGIASGTSNGLQKMGTGTLTLSGANSYTGSTTVSAGTLQLAGGAALADSSAVTVASGATLDLANSETIASLAGAGHVTLNAQTLTAGASNTSTTFSGDIAGTGGLTKAGSGVLTLSGTSTYDGATAVNAGTLAVTGAITGAGAVGVASGATLGGSGALAGDVTLASGAVIGGANASSAGHLTLNGGLSLASGSTLSAQLGGATAGTGYDQLSVHGAIALNGATLDLSLINSYVPGASSYKLIDNTGSGAVGGTFIGLAEGAAMTLGGIAYTISYAGGDGNDVVLSAPPAPTTVSDVSATGANGTHGVGDIITINVTFSGAITVTGTPQLALETGGVDRVINYSAGSGGTTLSFSYTVQAGDSSADLDYLGTAALTLNGGSILDAGSHAAVLTLAAPGAAHSLGANQAIVIDTVVVAPPPPPTVIDGVVVGIVASNDPATGLHSTELTVPITSPTRVDDPTSGHPGLTDIPLGLTSGAGGPFTTLQIGLPGATGMVASGVDSLMTRDQAAASLLGQIVSHTATGSPAPQDLGLLAQGFFNGQGNGILVETQALTLSSADDATPGAAIEIRGSSIVPRPGVTPSSAIALVLDTGALAPGAVINLNNVDFAAVVGAATLRGGDGNNFVVGDGAAQNMLLGAGNDILYGGGGNDIIGSAGGGDLLDGGSGDDTVVGGIGDDALAGGSGDDILQGGRSDQGQWHFYLSSKGVITASHQTALFAPAQSETLALASLDASQPALAFLGAHQVQLTDFALLYHAGLGRAPEFAGLDFWISNGQTALGLAQAILDSAEWTAAGPLSDSALVELVFQRALGRAPAASGAAFWLAALAGHDNVPGISRAEFLLEISQSAEHVNGQKGGAGIQIAAGVNNAEAGWIKGGGNDVLEGGAGNDVLIGGDGYDTVIYSGKLSDYKLTLASDGKVHIIDKANGDNDTISGIESGSFQDGTVDLSLTQAGSGALHNVAMLYQTVLGRTAELPGAAFWVASHQDAGQLAATLLQSAEFSSHYGTLDNAGFVAALYHNASLAADAAGGMQGWTDYLGQHSRAELVASFIGNAAVIAAETGPNGLWLV